jgi:hypothetical protein
MADDVIGGAAFDMHVDIGIFAGNARKERRQHANRGWIDSADRNPPRRLAATNRAIAVDKSISLRIRTARS